MFITDYVILIRLRDVPAGVKDGKPYNAYFYAVVFTEGETDSVNLYVTDETLKAKLRATEFHFGDVLKVNVEKKNGKMVLRHFEVIFRLREHFSDIDLFETEEV